MSNLSVFEFENKKVRFVQGLPVAVDVARVLGYLDPSATISKKIEEDYKEVVKLSTLEKEENNIKRDEIIVLKEAGIYQLIFQSKLPIAKDFQKWVFEEVLPSIRKTGKYELPQNNLESKLDKLIGIVSSQQKELQELKSEVKEAKIVKEKITIHFKGVGEMLNKSLNTSDKDYKLTQEVFQEYDYLKLIDIIKIFRPEYITNSMIFKKLLNKVHRSAGTTYRDVSLGETVSKIKSNIVFNKNQVSSVLITIDRCYKEIMTDLRFNDDDGQMSLF
jgi:prophage antirepressor-like protein